MSDELDELEEIDELEKLDELEELYELSKSRTVPIVNGVAFTRDMILAALETQRHSNDNDSHASTARTSKPVVEESGSDYRGKVIDEKYKVLALLGQGGMGAVYLAHHIRLNKDVALKTFDERNLTDDNRQRFQREAQSIGKLQHKNIVHVFDYGITDSGAPYYTMEVLEGENVAERINRKGHLQLDEAITIFRELCDGLSVCHQRKVVHRDIKPANIFLELKSSTDDTIQSIKLVDFGIAALVDESIDVQRLTAVGTVFGSPLYMSPEQGMGLKVDARSDIYSSACALFEMLTGRPPYCAANAFATMICHQQAPIPTLDSTSGSTHETYPSWLEKLIANMLAKDPADRVQTVQEIIDVIDYNSSKNEINTRKSNAPHSKSKRQADEGLESPTTENETTISGRPDPKKLLLVAGMVSAILLLILAFIFGSGQNADKKSATSTIPKFTLQETSMLDSSAGEAPKSEPNSPLSSEQAPAAQIVAPYRLLDTGDGKIHYHFPSPSIGMIGQGNELHGVEATGDVVIDDGPDVFFRAKEPVVDNPELLQGFGKADLRTLILDPIATFNRNWSQRTTKSIRHLKSLKKLSAPISGLPKETIADLNELPQLEDLVIDGSSMTGWDLVKLKRLPDLKFLTISGMVNCAPIFEVLSKRNNLRHLSAEECNLNDSDMLNIGKLSQLERLEVGGNHITDKNLSALLNLKNLHRIVLSSNPITPAALPTMLKMNKPNTIYMPNEFQTPTTKKAMIERYGKDNVDSDRPKNQIE